MKIGKKTYRGIGLVLAFTIGAAIFSPDVLEAKTESSLEWRLGFALGGGYYSPSLDKQVGDSHYVNSLFSPGPGYYSGWNLEGKIQLGARYYLKLDDGRLHYELGGHTARLKPSFETGQALSRLNSLTYYQSDGLLLEELGFQVGYDIISQNNYALMVMGGYSRRILEGGLSATQTASKDGAVFMRFGSSEIFNNHAAGPRLGLRFTYCLKVKIAMEFPLEIEYYQLKGGYVFGMPLWGNQSFAFPSDKGGLRLRGFKVSLGGRFFFTPDVALTLKYSVSEGRGIYERTSPASPDSELSNLSNQLRVVGAALTAKSKQLEYRNDFLVGVEYKL